MPKITSLKDLGAVKDAEEFKRHAAPVIKETVDVVNGKLEFDKNMNTQTVSVVFAQANVDTAVPHNLNRLGLKYFPVSKSVDCSIYDGKRAQAKNVIYLRSTQPATVSLILF